MSTEMYVYLGISKFKEDPKLITELVGVRPTKVQRTGDPIGNSKLKCKFNSWEYRIKATSKFELEPLVKVILAKFRNKKNLAKAISHGEGAIVCVLHTSDTTPSIELSSETIANISELNCGFWLDFYPRAHID